MTGSVAQRLAEVGARIEDARSRYGAGPVALMLAVKRRSGAECVEAARALQAAGRQVLLGHNHVQEARDTSPSVRAAGIPGTSIHLIGHLQTNKIPLALAHVDAIDTIDSVRLVDKIAARLDPQRSLDVFMQVNTSGEATKSGISPAEAPALADAIAEVANMRLRGLMTVGALSDDEATVRRSYAALRELRARLHPDHPDCVELSMGMSGDFALAIAEGATIVRIGQAILGPRERP
ncbi:YggS family pyridoxal phosphate-dependent enzyme [Nanchangia anserum]|uniref:Pyridoxal phosphate homeostasis protein n=1 Tax=Nanchangia anserum TaxID=2692125 RepID=A0A8I0KN51_9ACTO|nr:YggS family pyridoxal phosphate-dependent enzyme [Nanchangia anserum]MBD3688911.1 YggS family pyridoxal phosphate-dependent enzyme [Nanchangia anserum]QOX81175.1 YggS family pyridoxal phosphate-dependent enzyme [Nanchangia anserum]